MPRKDGTRKVAREKALSERGLTPEYLDEQLTLERLKERLARSLLLRLQRPGRCADPGDVNVGDLAHGLALGYLAAVGRLPTGKHGKRYRLGYLKRILNFCKRLEAD